MITWIFILLILRWWARGGLIISAQTRLRIYDCRDNFPTTCSLSLYPVPKDTSSKSRLFFLHFYLKAFIIVLSPHASSESLLHPFAKTMSSMTVAPHSSHDQFRILFELICIVINSTKNVATLDRWCIATSQYLALLKLCLGAWWASVVITQRDFLDSRGDIDSAPISDAFDSLIPALTCSFSPFQSAAFIQKLDLFFHFSPPSTTLSEDGLGHDTVWDDLSCSEDMQYSLSILLPVCIGLSELEHHGTLHQDNLDLLKTLVELPLRKLALRKTAVTVLARWRCSPHPYVVFRDGTRANGLRSDF